MSATTELRRLLDERGVKWWPMHDVEAGYYQDHDTEFVVDGRKYTAHEWGGRLTVYGLTPAQAVEATLGRETCHNASEYPRAFFCCSECGCAHKRNRAYVDMPRFCPNCGAEVVTE